MIFFPLGGQPRRSRGGRGYGRRGGAGQNIAVGNDFDFDNAQLDKKALEDEFQKLKIGKTITEYCNSIHPYYLTVHS